MFRNSNGFMKINCVNFTCFSKDVPTPVRGGSVLDCWLQEWDVVGTNIYPGGILPVIYCQSPC